MFSNKPIDGSVVLVSVDGCDNDLATQERRIKALAEALSRIGKGSFPHAVLLLDPAEDQTLYSFLDKKIKDCRGIADSMANAYPGASFVDVFDINNGIWVSLT